MTRDVINPEAHQRTADAFHFSAAARAGGLVILSGVIGANGNRIPDTAEEEFRNAWTQIGTVLREAGLGYENILEYTSYHVDMQDHLADFMKVRDEFIDPPWPAWTAIGCTGLAIPGARVEIKVVAGG
jgi:enamine deaminase RidA (YjgF/YER057c/UK114 family)